MVRVTDPGVRALLRRRYGSTDTDVKEVRDVSHRTALSLGVVDRLPDTVELRVSEL